VSYIRVSTDQQGRSGLGLEAQRQAVASRVHKTGGTVVAEFLEVESGKRADRPQLAAALASCRTRRAVLIVAKLDRLARNARFLLSVIEGTGEAGCVFCDLPTVPAGPMGKFILATMASIAELEAGLISQRTRAALAIARERGTVLGNPRLTPGTPARIAKARAARARKVEAARADVLPVLHQIRAEGHTSLRAIGAALEARGVLTPTGKPSWSASQVRRLIGAAAPAEMAAA